MSERQCRRKAGLAGERESETSADREGRQLGLASLFAVYLRRAWKICLCYAMRRIGFVELFTDISSHCIPEDCHERKYRYTATVR